jgi:hypothetical protein
MSPHISGIYSSAHPSDTFHTGFILFMYKYTLYAALCCFIHTCASLCSSIPQATKHPVRLNPARPFKSQPMVSSIRQDSCLDYISLFHPS